MANNKQDNFLIVANSIQNQLKSLREQIAATAQGDNETLLRGLRAEHQEMVFVWQALCELNK